MTNKQEPPAKKTARHMDLGAMRTVMAAERTLMAWIRTSLSMLSFGFTIYKILDALQEGGTILPQENTPQNAGLFLAVAGTLAIVMGTIEYWMTLRQLQLLEHFRLGRPALLMALLICVSGLFLTVSIAFNLF